MTETRLDYITIAKGVAIILMVVGHSGAPYALYKFIYLFHMPLFFFVSGFCFKDKYLQDPKDFIIKKIKGIYVPYVKYALVFWILHNVFLYLHFYDETQSYSGSPMFMYSINDYVDELISILLKMHTNDIFLGGFWFLRELFLGSLIFYFLIKCIRSKFVVLIVLFFLSVLFRWKTVNLPLVNFFHITFLSTLFMALGYSTRDFYSQIKKSWTDIICIGLLAILGIFVYPADMFSVDCFNIQTYIFFAVAGILYTLFLSHKIAEESILLHFFSYVGERTMPILALHFISFKLVSYIYICIEHEPIKRLAEYPVVSNAGEWVWIIYSIVGVFIPLGIDYLITKKR